MDIETVIAQIQHASDSFVVEIGTQPDSDLITGLNLIGIVHFIYHDTIDFELNAGICNAGIAVVNIHFHNGAIQGTVLCRDKGIVGVLSNAINTERQRSSRLQCGQGQGCGVSIGVHRNQFHGDGITGRYADSGALQVGNIGAVDHDLNTGAPTISILVDKAAVAVLHNEVKLQATILGGGVGVDLAAFQGILAQNQRVFAGLFRLFGIGVGLAALAITILIAVNSLVDFFAAGVADLPVVGLVGGDPVALALVLADDFLAAGAGPLAICPLAVAVSVLVEFLGTVVADLPVVVVVILPLACCVDMLARFGAGSLKVEVDGDLAAGLAVALRGADHHDDLFTSLDFQRLGVRVAVLGIVVRTGQLGALGVIVLKGVLPVLTGNHNGHSAVNGSGEVIVVRTVAGQDNLVVALHQILRILLGSLGNLHRDVEGLGLSPGIADLNQSFFVHQNLDNTVFSIVGRAINDYIGILASNNQILTIEGVDSAPRAVVIVGLQLVPHGSAGSDLNGIGGTIGIQQFNGICQATSGMLIEALIAQADDRCSDGIVPTVIIQDLDGDFIAGHDLKGLVEAGNRSAIDGVLNIIAQFTGGDFLAAVQKLHDGDIQGSILGSGVHILQILSDVVLAQNQSLRGGHILKGHVAGVGVAVQRVYQNGDDLTGGHIELGRAAGHGLAID